MSCCGGNCGCGPNCKCSGCNGCPSFTETATATQAMIIGTAPTMGFEMSEMNFGSENDCKCGSNCSCVNCTCNK
ncbi:Metallothionein-like protein 1 [Linum perenne]